MIKKGNYAIYKDKEYKAYKTEDNKIELVSRDENDVIKKQFKPSFKYGKLQLGIYKKIVSTEDLETAYEITSWGKYKGRRYQITSEDDDGRYIMVGTLDSQAAKDFETKYPDRNDCYILAPKDKIELIEEKKAIWGFEIFE